MSIREVRNSKDMFLAAAADLALRPFAFIVSMFRGGKKGAVAADIAVKKVLIMRVDNIGDVVMVTPLARELKRIFGAAKIDMLVMPEAVTLFKKNPYVENVIPYHGYGTIAQVRRNGYNLAIEPRGDIRYIFFLFLAGIRRRAGFDRAGGAYMLTDVVPYDLRMSVCERNMEIVRYFDKGAGAEEYSELFETEAGIKEADALLAGIGAGKRILGIFPCSKFAAKEWEPGKFGILAKKASDDGFFPVICGAKGEAEKCKKAADLSGGRAVNCAGKLSLEGLVSFIKRCECVVGNDSAPARIAEALGVPAVIIYGPMDPDIVKP
ncbi:MAG: glycosyltransferase family 9 protein [Candidatus Omnitrophota bacterium]|jgi:heptosyltransferase-2